MPRPLRCLKSERKVRTVTVGGVLAYDATVFGGTLCGASLSRQRRWLSNLRGAWRGVGAKPRDSSEAIGSSVSTRHTLGGVQTA
jgi:hypothetical protein